VSLFAYTAAAELRQQLRSRVFWIVFTVSLIMVLGASAIDALRLEAASRLGTGAGLIVRVHLIWSLFYLFTAAAFVADAVIRDEQTRFAPIVRATPAPLGPYVLGRFAGAFGAVLVCFLSVPIGLLAAPFIPSADPGWVPPLDPSVYLLSLLVLAVPNLFAASALFFGLAVATRSLTGCFLGAVVLLVLYGLNQEGGASGLAVQLVEPFGFAATSEPGAGPEVGAVPPALWLNRLLWLTVAALALWLGYRLSLKEPKSSRPRRARRAAPAKPLPPAREGTGKSPLWAVRLWVRTAHELRMTMFNLPFAVLLMLGLASAAAALWAPAAAGASTAQLLPPLIESFQLVPAVMALFFAGELMWSEQAHRIAPIVDATPAPPALLVFAKFVALALLLLAAAVVTGAAVAVVQLVSGHWPDLGLLMRGYVLPKAFDWVLFGVLALFLQALAPNKLAGWGLLVLYLIGGLALDQAGLDDPSYRYAGYPGAPLPPALTGAEGVLWYRLQWGGVALLMLGAALLLAGRRSGWGRR